MIGVEDVLDGGLVRHVDRLADRAGEEALGRGHHHDVPHVMDEARALLAALVGGVEDRQMLVLQVWGALDRHRAADVLVGSLDLSRVKPRREADRSRVWLASVHGDADAGHASLRRASRH